MNVYTFTNPINGQQFQIEGPDALTEAQARQIFQQQLDAGSLVGLKSGDLINSATQLAGGLKSAASQLSQSLAGVGGSTQGALTGAFDAATQSASSINLGSITGTLQSAAGKSLGAINSTINNLVPANPINIADLSKQATGLVPIQGLSQVDVRAAMSSVSTAVDQAATVLSDDKGLGKFGLDATQLERAGMLKPGTVSTYLSDGAANLSQVLNSPSVWTGAGGITDVSKLLESVPSQEKIQQQLMSQGLSSLKDLGIPTDQLSVDALSGTALNAAKSLGDAAKWAQNLPLPAEVKSALDTAARDGAFATNFANQNANDAVLQQDPAQPASDTADRATIDAATTRVTGSDKVPEVNYQSGTAKDSIIKLVQSFSDNSNQDLETYKKLNASISDLSKAITEAKTSNDPIKLSAAIDKTNNTISDYEALQGDLQGLQRQVTYLTKEWGNKPTGYTTVETLQGRVSSALANLESSLEKLKKQLASQSG